MNQSQEVEDEAKAESKLQVPKLYSAGDYVRKVKSVERGLTKRGYTMYKVRFEEVGFPLLYLVRHPQMDRYKYLWLWIHGQTHYYQAEWVKPPESGDWLIGLELNIRIKHQGYPMDEQTDKIYAVADWRPRRER